MRLLLVFLLLTLAFGADTDPEGDQGAKVTAKQEETADLNSESNAESAKDICSHLQGSVWDENDQVCAPCPAANEYCNNIAPNETKDRCVCVGTCTNNEATNANGVCAGGVVAANLPTTSCVTTSGDAGTQIEGQSCVSLATFATTGNDDSEVEVGTVSSTVNIPVDQLKTACTYPGYGLPGHDELGSYVCNNQMNKVIGGVINPMWYMAMKPMRCYVMKFSADQLLYSALQPQGVCDCVFPKVISTAASCVEFTCAQSTVGSACLTCVSESVRTRSNECSSCNAGFVLHRGDCLKMDCTEDPNHGEWRFCQACRTQASRRHPQDCAACAHGYHFRNEQRNVPNATSSDAYSQGSLVVLDQETGYCFPYTCIAGGNLVAAGFPSLTGTDLTMIHNAKMVTGNTNQRVVKVTSIVSTVAGALDQSVPPLPSTALAFRDHCRTCVPQQMRFKTDHCETCNPGYYLDEMHHTCRKKTCGIPHFRRNAVSCTLPTLVPKPWSTPCTDCEDNDVRGDDSCCVSVPPVLTCGAQNVFCAAGTQKSGFDSISCDADGCKHYSSLCCDPMTCKNQQVSCFPYQTRLGDDTECELCANAGTECCEAKPLTCAIAQTKCAPNQTNQPGSTPCTTCVNDGLECCTPVQKTCQNQGVFCHAGTHVARDGETPVTCSKCENYEEECCTQTTCKNQRVSCAAGRVHKGDIVCNECIHNTLECCEPLPPVQETCGNQLVKCESRLYRPAASHCSTTDETCNDYGVTCCVPKTCGNQGVGCSDLQAALQSTTVCTNCADGGDECCTNARTCGLMGVMCTLGGYRAPTTACTGCAHFDENECCTNVPKTCDNQGVVCLSGTRRTAGSGCTDCEHYGSECCAPKTCGNQNVGCSRGRARLGADVECAGCHHDDDNCCAAEKRTCAAMSVKCMDGHYEANLDTVLCGDKCTNYATPCCVPYVRTCQNQNVACGAEQTVAAFGTTCNDCVNRGSECCTDIAQTCANQNVVCRPGHKVAGYATKACEACLNDAVECCKPYVRTCGNQNVVCSAQQTYKLPEETCTICDNHGSNCCEDIPKTCANQRVACRPGHYNNDYAKMACVGCMNDDTAECCVAFVTRCGNQNVQCNANQVPKEPQTVCDTCNNNSQECCVDVAETCANQSVVCRPGHYTIDYATTQCGSQGCLNDAQPCCDDFVPTCGTEHVKCRADQTYRNQDTHCNGSCTPYGGTCCVDVTHTCKNQGVICRPGYFRQGYQTLGCSVKGCTHHGDACCEEYKKTCGNQDVVCSAGQTYQAPGEVCNDCMNNDAECCIDIQKTCKNQQVVCRAGHYADTWAVEACGANCNNDVAPCCKAFQTTCGNMNVQCGADFTPMNPGTACDGEQCTNDSGTCCTPVTATCANQNVVCRPGHYVEAYLTTPCAGANCLNDAAPCCKTYVKTCANQHVQCSAGLMKHGKDSDTPCDDCENYGTECCEEITKTCGNSGQECRQDLYLPQNTQCTTCGTDQCCEPIPDPAPTCANQKHLCASAHYKPVATKCEGTFSHAKCTDALCCHSFPVNCGNQNVKCHVGTYLKHDTACTDCAHYGEECCSPVTCESAAVTCDYRTLKKIENFADVSCKGATGDCYIENDSQPCCVPNLPQAKAPTCLNKYGTDVEDKEMYPFLKHLDGVIGVSCESALGYYPRIDDKTGVVKNAICGDTTQRNKANGPKVNFSACQDNDFACCWKKTCKDNAQNLLVNGMNNGGEGPTPEDFGTVECSTKTGGQYKLKDNAEYIVCQGDCLDDCCDLIPPADTCMSAKVACSYGYERSANWETAECNAECVENSATCCKRTDCRQVNCNDTTQTRRVGALCFDCYDEDEECCEDIPIADTCSNQRVHCGYGFFKVNTYATQTCTNCLDDASECCVAKTCGARGLGDAVSCTTGAGNFKAKAATTACYTCVNDGAECCDPVAPLKTCENQDVNCGFGYTHNDVLSSCADCLDNGSECCTQNTCASTKCTADGLKAKASTTACTLCMDNHDECCTKQETCWTSKVVCPIDTYHKHPNLICGDKCSEETCCAQKTCENQGVCCNNNLGFSKAADFTTQACSSCADNCEECCSFDTPTCSSAMVGCGFGFHRKTSVDNVACTSCALNDRACCEPRTCGADADIDGAYTCPTGFDYLGDDIKCHFCAKAECCKPTKPVETCRSEHVNCGIGMKRVADSNKKPCSTCVQNDSVCCEAMTCAADAICPTTHTTKGAVLCVGCQQDECCDIIPTCDSANVGCGFGQKRHEDQSVTCSTCAMNDAECCEPLTCGTDGIACPTGFKAVADQAKSCAFCELSECCEPIMPTKTCSNQNVGCGHGFNRIAESGSNACGQCEMNNSNCCGQRTCDADQTCPVGTKRKTTVTDCGFCTVEECCVPIAPPKTCANQQVGCGFGWKTKVVAGLAIDRSSVCSTCAHNDLNCCQPKTCGNDGPTCSDHMMQGAVYTEKGVTMECSDCDVPQCCVPPVIQKTCMNQSIMCSGHFDKVSTFGNQNCADCVNNGEECCTQRTCSNQGVTCSADLMTKVANYGTQDCLVCASNSIECCEPKICGTEFLDVQNTCPTDTHTTNPRNKPCVNCDQGECCTPLPTLKCTEIIIEHGQAFYSRPAGSGSQRTRGSVLTVECDLGYKFQSAEYFESQNLNTRDQDLNVVDFPVCNPKLMESLIEGHVEVFSPTTSGWNRAPPVCRPVTCPPLDVTSKFLQGAENKWDIGQVLYRDAQMDQVPMRGAGYGPRDYAGEADVTCNEGWIRVPNVCSEVDGGKTDAFTDNTLDYELKGFWRMEGNVKDQSPHCTDSRGEGNGNKDATKHKIGTCNDGVYNGPQETYVEGVPVDGQDSKGLEFDGKTTYIEVHDEYNPNWGYSGIDNELNHKSTQWTVSFFAKMDENTQDNDGFFFARYTTDYEQEVVSVALSNGRVKAVYNDEADLGTPEKLNKGIWNSIIVRMDGRMLEIFINGELQASRAEIDPLQDTEDGHVFIGADKETSEGMGGFFHGKIDEVRYYTRGISDDEIMCISNGRSTCGPSQFYAKPYNTQGCNRESEQIKTAEECRLAISELLQDSILGNSLNGGDRFGRTIRDEQKAASYDDVPSYCSYREEDAQIIFNPNANGRAHTSLAPICRTNPKGTELTTVGCLPKCLSNGEWNVELPTCEKDWCHPIFQEWSCCANRLTEKDQSYWKGHHKQSTNKCPIGYGDCDDDTDCVREDHKVRGLCSQRRDLDNIDVCITDLDPCGGVKGATGTLCVVMTAVGVDYHSHADSGLANNLFIGGSILVLGSLAGYYMMRPKKGEEHTALLEEEL